MDLNDIVINIIFSYLKNEQDLICSLIKVLSYNGIISKEIISFQEIILYDGDYTNCGYIELFERLERLDNTLLQTACKTHDIKIIELLLKNNANVNTKSCIGRTPLHEICDLSNEMASGCIKNYNRIKAVKLFLKNGANINELDNNDNTPLHYVCCKGNNVDMAQFLLKNGAIILQNNNGDSPLHAACGIPVITFVHIICYEHPKKREHNIKIVKLLLKNNADINLMNKCGDTPLHKACECCDGNLVTLLLRSGAKHLHEI